MAAALKNILIVIFVLAAIGIIIFMLLFLHPRVGDNAKTLRVRFTDIDKVNVGTRVTFAGHPVGEVVQIRELPEVRTGRMSKDGEVYAYELVLKIDSGVDVFNTDKVLMRTSGLLGERNIEISPRPLKPEQKLINIEKEVIYAEQVASVEDTMKQLGELSKKIQGTLDDFHATMEEIRQNEIIPKLGKSIQNISDITTVLNQPQKIWEIVDHAWTLTERANQSMQNIHELTEKANHSWEKVDQSLEGFRLTAQNAMAFSQKANQIIDYARQGKGTIGQLFMNEDLYLRLKSIFHKGETVMDDIKTYGILFQLDKRWQRLQANRLRLLQRLAKPEAFAHYFYQEMDQISSSLSRVSVVLNESECDPRSLIYNPDFTKRFAELLRRVENMEDSLKMYNEQIIEQGE